MQTGANMQKLRYVVLTKGTLREITPIALKVLEKLDVTKVDRKYMRVPSGFLNFQQTWERRRIVYQKSRRDLLFHGAPNALMVVSRRCNELDGVFNIGHISSFL